MMLVADRDDAAHRRRHDGARLRPHRQHRVAQRENSAARARPVERRALRASSASSAGWRGRPSRATSPSTICLPGIFDSDAQREHIRGMLTETGKTFDEIWRERAAGQSGQALRQSGRARRLLRVSLLGACRLHHRPESADRRRKLSGDVSDNRCREDRRHETACIARPRAGLRARRAAPALAQTYPSRTVTVVVPFPAGGSVDGVARILVQKLNETVGQHFIVENRAGGASGTVGANAVAKAAPDGYTLLVSASVHVINPFLYKNVPYDVVNDFTPITLLADGPLIVSTTPSVPANNLKDFFDLVRKDPQKYTFGDHQHRLGQPSRDRAAQARRRARHAGHRLQGHGAGADRPDERADPAARRSDAVLAAAGAGRQDQGARPSPASSARPPRRRSRPSRSPA